MLTSKSCKSTFKYCKVGFAFCLQILALIGLLEGLGWAKTGIVKGEHQASQPPQSAADGTKPMAAQLQPDEAAMVAMSEFPVLDEIDRKPKDEGDKIEPVTRKVPIWGEQARQRGYDLPLPFGMGFNYTYMDQGIRIRNLKIGIGDPNIAVEGLDFDDARSHDSAVTARFDMWLLPFLNMYGLFGSVNGEAEFDLDISKVTDNLPVPGPPPVVEPNRTINLNMDYNGITFGGGFTLAAGYQNFFGSLDTNYTYSTVDIVDGRIDTITVSPRLGLIMDPPDIKGSIALWIGAMYMHYKQTVTGDANLKEFDPQLPPVELAFKLDVENDYPWNFLLGGQWEVTKRLQFMVEGGVGDRGQLVTGISYRF